MTDEQAPYTSEPPPPPFAPLDDAKKNTWLHPFPSFIFGAILCIIVMGLQGCFGAIGGAFQLVLTSLLSPESVPFEQLMEQFALSPVLLGIVNTAAVGSVLFAASPLTRSTLREVYPFRGIPFIAYLPLIVMMIGLGFAVSELDNNIRALYPMPEFLEQASALSADTLPALIALAFVLVVIAPLTEELLFRGLIMHGFLRRYSARAAIVLSAALFAVLHVNPWIMPSIMVLGIALGYLRVASKGVWAPMFAHGLHNGAVFCFAYLKWFPIQGYSVDYEDGMHQPIALTITGVILAIGGFYVLARLLKKKDAEHLDDLLNSGR